MEELSLKQKICSSLNPIAACKKYEVPLSQCPQFLFLVMGFAIIVAIIATYLVGAKQIGNPMFVALLVIAITAFLLIISFVITSSLERLADASRMKSEFIHIVSHQLRAPLTNLRFSLDFLTSSKLETEDAKSEYYNILKENTSRMSDLIDNLLTVSRIASGKFPLKKEPISLVNITERLIKKFQPFITASNVKVSFQKKGNPPDIIGDGLWLEQVVENLLDNAVKYTRGGGVIEIEIKNKNNKTILFTIKDSGVGIPQGEQKFIFERFFRSQNALKQQTQGSGLGLHIVKKVVELSGGKIWFRSKEGKGTTFYFVLPV